MLTPFFGSGVGYFCTINAALYMQFIPTVKALLAFVRRPNDVQWHLTKKEKLQLFFYCLGFEILLTLFIIIPLLYAIDSLITLKTSAVNYDETILFTLLLMVLFVPYIEELIFRHFLRYQGFKAWVINRAKWNRIFPALVYMSSLLFGLVHATNFENTELEFYLLIPVVVISQLTGGLVIAFIRVRLNFYWGFFMHAVWNFIFTMLFPIGYTFFTQPYTEKSPNYSITIEERPFFQSNRQQVLKIDSSAGKIFAIEVKQYGLRHLLDTLYTAQSLYVNDVLVNINFKSGNGVSKKEFLAILQKEYEIEGADLVR